MQILPLTNESIQKFQTRIGNDMYGFRISYNSRGDYWTMDIYDSQNILLAASIKIVLGVNLVRAYQLNIGKLIAVNQSEIQNDPGSKAILGTDVLVYQLTENDIKALRSLSDETI